jgi:class 3 adenylate cyclase
MWDDPVYAHALNRLARLGRVIVVDIRGLGASDPVPLGALPTIEAWADDVRIVLDAVGCSSVTVIANGNFSGPIGLFFAATYPQRTAALVLLDSAARSLPSDDYPIGLPAAVVERVLDATERGWGRGPIGDAMVPGRADDESFRSWHARLERTSASPGSARAHTDWGLRLDLRPILPNIRVPTLVMHSESNTLLRLELGRYLANHISGAQLVVLPGGDRTLYGERADEVLDHVEEFITGVRPVRDVDRALATVLFSDIVASTEHATRLGDRKWTDVLNRHDAVVSRELNRHRGRKVNPTGDGILATFDGPARAVRCAQAIIESVRPLGIEVRAGLHTGEVELRGEDIGGIAVHIAARVMAQAGAGEVLVSSTVKDLVAGSGIAFADRGTHALKGVPDEWRLFAVET